MSDYEQERPQVVCIKVYGEQAKHIVDGDLFRAKVTDVEGRKVVKLFLGGMEE